MGDDGAMARFVLTAMPFTGHITPMRAVAQGLVARGHDVRFYTGAAYAHRVEADGARFLPWRAAPDFDENDLVATFPRLRGERGFGQVFRNLEDLFLGTAPGQADDLAAEWEREPWDVLVGEESTVGPAFTAERTGSRWATVGVLPLSLPSRQGPPAGLGIRPGVTPVGWGRDRALRELTPLMMRPLAKVLARVRAEAGLPPSALRFDEAVFSRELILPTGVAALDHDRTDRPPYLHFVGRLAPEARPESLPPWWHELDDRRVVHVTQGTQNIDPDDLLRPAFDALADEDALVVATTGIRGRDTLPFPVPQNVRVAGFIPHDALLPHADVVVTNGGWGGVLAALSHGIPLILAGGDLDKPEVAARVAHAGAGVDIGTPRPRPRQVALAYRAVSRDASYAAAARRIAGEISAAGGASRAVELLEALAGRTR